MACITFLYLNGWHVQAPDDEKIALMLDVATGIRSESDIASWLQLYATALLWQGASDVAADYHPW